MLTATSTIPPILATCLAILVLRRLSWRKRGPEFPGPKGLPIIGNAHQFPKEEVYLKWKEWNKRYGPIVQVKAFSQPIIIIDSHRIATELLAERGQIYSGRPFLPMGSGECKMDRYLPLMDTGPNFRDTRKMLHRVLEGKMVEKFKLHVESETHKFLERVHAHPDAFRTHIRTTSAAIILLISHGYTVDTNCEQDRFVKLAETVNHESGIALEPGRWWVDIFPFLKYIPSWFPGVEFKKLAEQLKRSLEIFDRETFDWVKNEMKEGRALPSCARAVLEEDDNSIHEDIIMTGMGILYAAGGETMVSLNSTFFLAMACHPEIASKAQAELDSVVGPSRLPTWEDRTSLPYIEAILTEVMRYAPPGPIGLPHKSGEDDVYQGCFIEKGTMLFANIWGIAHDEEIFDRPFDFVPERYLEGATDAPANGKWKYIASTPDPRAAIFGYGRRYCPGRDLAIMEAWHLMALTLHVFDIKMPENSPRSLSDYKFLTATVTHPPEFKCDITPRSKAAESLISNIVHNNIVLDIGV